MLRDLSAAAERNIAETQAELAEEAKLLERVVLEALEAAGAGAGAVAIRAEALAGSEPALRRLALRALAERATGRAVPLGRRRAAQIMRLAMTPEGGEVDLGGGVRAICEQGLIRFETSTEADAAPAPGSASSPGELPVRAAGRSAPSFAPGRSSRRGRTWRRSTRRRSETSWSSAPGARATGCGRSAWTAARACRTYSPIGASRVPSVTAFRW